MREILPGLHHWTTGHPNLGQPVSSYYLAESAALLDPMVPDEGLTAFGDLARPRHVVLSSRHHDRDHAKFVESFGCSFHVNVNGVHEYQGEDVQSYAVGDEPVPGISAIANGPIAPDDMVLLIEVEGGALAFADSLVHEGDEELAFMPDGLLGDDPAQVKARIAAALGELLDQGFHHLLFAHGPPIVQRWPRSARALRQRAGRAPVERVTHAIPEGQDQATPHQACTRRVSSPALDYDEKDGTR